jgi:hypothetical protein
VRQIFACALLLVFSHAALAVPVFPGAVGFGTETEAGRGGNIVRVTKLTDDGTAGTLRDAVTNSSYGTRRVVVFEVSGIITLTSSIKISRSNTTIAGQTAPPPGIMIRGADLIVGANNVLIQHIHSRVGDDPNGPPFTNRSGFQVDGFNTTGISNIVFDHVSAAWAPDQTFLVWSSGGPTASNITVSNSIMAEGLRFSPHPKAVGSTDGHSTGPLFALGARNVTMYRDISAFNRWRNPLVRANASGIQVVNNFFYWPRYRERARFHSDIDQIPDGPDAFQQVSSFHGNSYFATPEPSAQNNPQVAWVSTSEANTLQLYADDNRLFTPILGATSRADGGSLRPAAGEQPWDLIEHNAADAEITKLPNPPATFPVLPLISSDKVEKFLLANAGARSAYRDEIDSRVIRDIERGNYDRGYNLDLGYLDSPEQVGGYPVWVSVPRPFVSLANDNGDTDSDGYTNLEERLHEMAFRLEGDQRVARFDTFQDNEYASNWHIESGAFALGIVNADGSLWLQQGADNTDARAMLLKTYFYDTVVQAKVKPMSFANDTRFVRVYARYRDKERNYHLLLRENDRVEIRRQDGPTSTLLGTFASLPINTTDQYAVRLSVVGGAISARVQNLTTNAVVTLNHTDPNPLPPGFAGTGTFFASARFDDFFAGPTGTATPQLTEDFDDGNETGWSESNGSWSVVSSSGSPVYRQDLNTLQLLARASWNTNVASPNQSVQATVRPLEFNGTSFVSVHARYIDPNNSYYVTLRNDRRFELKKIRNGTVEQALTRTVTMHSTFRLDEPHTLKIEVIGTEDPVLVGYLDGAPLLTVEDETDTPFTGAGKAAMGTFSARAEFDNVVISSP